jgi:lipid-A-disaccharide synthase
MKEADPGIRFLGVGGKMMKEAGVEILVPSSELAVVGLTEVFSRARTILKAFLRLKSIIKNKKPSLVILIDYPDFNISLARSAKRSRVPVLYYISPQVWAWRKGRVRKLAGRVDRMAVILPFEEGFYRQKGMRVEYVGHPLLDAVPSGLDREEIRIQWNLQRSSPIVGLLPGSRREEVVNLLPSMLKAMEILKKDYPNLACLLPRANTIASDLIASVVEQSSIMVHITEGDIYRVLQVCDLALVASGTATLETAVMGVPMIIVYRVSTFSYWVARALVRVPYIGLVNLIAGEKIVPELIQKEVTPENLSREALRLLEAGEGREVIIKNLQGIRDKLRKGASRRTAQIALEMMHRE